MVDILIALVVGGLVGWLGSLIMKTSAQMGIFANTAVGIVGSLLGFWLAGKLGIVAAGGLGRWIIAVLGAVLLIAILRALKIFR